MFNTITVKIHCIAGQVISMTRFDNGRTINIDKSEKVTEAFSCEKLDLHHENDREISEPFWDYCQKYLSN